jgi:RES domain-containing protein
VHLDLPFELLPNDFVLMHVTLPNRLVEQAGFTPPMNTVETGDAWLAEARRAALRVPSVLMPAAWNILLNPRHPEAAQTRVVAIETFGFDPRLWQPLATEG